MRLPRPACASGSADGLTPRPRGGNVGAGGLTRVGGPDRMQGCRTTLRREVAHTRYRLAGRLALHRSGHPRLDRGT